MARHLVRGRLSPLFPLSPLPLAILRLVTGCASQSLASNPRISRILRKLAFFSKIMEPHRTPIQSLHAYRPAVPCLVFSSLGSSHRQSSDVPPFSLFPHSTFFS